jgi:uncharacterized membrane protein YqhA
MKKKTNPIEYYFEKFLFSTRFLTLIAVLGSIFLSIIMFVEGLILIFHASTYFISSLTTQGSNIDEAKIVIMVISTVDKFLISTVLLIFGMGIYELFISKIDHNQKIEDNRPGWLHVKSLDDLKESLGRVILLILIVAFFEHTLLIKYESALDLLYLGIGILLISGSLYLSHKAE